VAMLKNNKLPFVVTLFVSTCNKTKIHNSNRKLIGSLNKQEEETQIHKKRKSFAKGKFHRVYNKLKQYIQEEEPMSVLQELLVDLEKSYTEAEFTQASHVLKCFVLIICCHVEK
jgi:hypothetical protein